MWNGVSNLGTPAGVAVGGEVVLSAFLRGVVSVKALTSEASG